MRACAEELVRPRIHTTIVSQAYPFARGRTDRCIDHGEANGLGWRVPIGEPARELGVPETLEDAPELLWRLGYAVLMPEHGVPSLDAKESAWVADKSALPSEPWPTRTSAVTSPLAWGRGARPASSRPIGTGGSQHWRPIFNDDVEEEEGFSLRQIHPCDERLSAWKGELKACLRRASNGRACCSRTRVDHTAAARSRRRAAC